MADKTRKAQSRADGALVGALSILVLGIAPIVGINVYGDRSSAAMAAVAAPELAIEVGEDDSSEAYSVLEDAPLSALAGTIAELAGARLSFASECLAEVMYYEARGEGQAGQKAVAEVVLARTHSSSYADSVCGVAYQGAQPGRKTGCQFSFACDGSLDKKRDKQAWRDVRLLAERIMSGVVRLGNETGNAIAFHSVGVTPAWTETMLRTVTIGNHVFYRLIPKV